MTLPTLDYQAPGLTVRRSSFSMLEKICLIALGVVLPLICFVLASRDYPLEPDWQKGGDSYIAFLPDGRAGFPFYPLLVFSMVALCLLVFRPAFSRLFAVRLGLLGGIVLGLQYTWIQAFAMGDPHIAIDGKCVLLVTIGLGSNFILLGMLKAMERIPGRVLAIIAAVGASMVVALTLAASRARVGRIAGLGEIFLACLAIAPAWSAGVYTKAYLVAKRLHREEYASQPNRRRAVAGCSVWLIAYATAWRWSVANALAMYAALPTSHPGCYIATAAAAGHPHFVRSTAIRAADGTVFRANAQLRRFKCAEIALATLAPTVHRKLRRAYDFAGPRLARIIAWHPLLADIAFATLKPLEWVAFASLIAVVPEGRHLARDVFPVSRARLSTSLFRHAGTGRG